MTTHQRRGQAFASGVVFMLLAVGCGDDKASPTAPSPMRPTPPAVLQRPVVTGVVFNNRPQNGDTYRAGERISVGIRLSQQVSFTGRPQLALTIGTSTRQATTYQDVSLMDFRSFYYTVQRDDRDADGIGIAANALALNGGTIRSAEGEDAILDLGTHTIGNDPDRKVDGSEGTEPEPTPVAAFASASQSTGEGAGTRNVTVNLSPTPTSALTLSYRVGGTATAGSDFSIVGSGTLSVLSGATTATIPVAITDDSTQESSETVILTLTSGNGYTVNSDFARHTLTIADNDATPPPAPAPEPDCSMQIQGNEFIVCYAEGYENDAVMTRDVLNKARPRLEAKYGRPSGLSLMVKLYSEPTNNVYAGYAYYDGTSFHFLTPSHPSRRACCNGIGLWFDDWDYLRKVLVHEYFHAFHDALNVDSYRRWNDWFREALPEYEGLTATNNPHLWQLTAEKVYRDNTVSCGRGFGGDEQLMVSERYWAGALMLRYLADRFGEASHSRMLHSRRGNVDEAIADELPPSEMPCETFDHFRNWMYEQYGLGEP